LFSPCSGILLPTYFSISFKQKSHLLMATVLFSIGVFLVSVPIGIGAGIIFSHFNQYLNSFLKIWGILLIIAGFFSLFSYNPIPKFKLSKKFDLGTAFLLGAISGLTLGSCIGPILGVILSFTAIANNLFQSVLLMSFYSLGIVSPLFIMALGISKLTFFRKILVVGKLFKINFLEKVYYIHSTNLFISIMFFALGYIFLFKHGLLPIAESNIQEILLNLYKNAK